MPPSQGNSDRTRTVNWQDPEFNARKASGISGLEYLQGIKDGKVDPPPAALLIGYRMMEVEPGRAVFELEPAEYHYNPFATVHGGIISTLIDTATTCAVLAALPAGMGCSTIEIKVNFVRPLTKRTGPVRCESKTIHVGSRIGIAEGRVTDEQGKLYAYGVSTCMIFSMGPLPQGG